MASERLPAPTAPRRPQDDLSGGAMRSYIAVRVLVGTVLLVADGPALVAIGGGTAPDRGERAFALALGARQLVEAMALWRRPSASMLRTGAAVDVLHGASTAWLATHPRHRRLAMVNLICAGGFALTGLVLAGRPVPTSGQPPTA